MMSVVLALVLVVGAVGAAIAAGTGTVEPPPSMAFVAHAENFPDALAAGPVAGRLDAPLFLTSQRQLGDDAASGLRDFDPEVVVIAGGEVAISATVEQQIGDLLPAATVRRVAGGTRTETAQKLAALIHEFDPAFVPGDATAADADLLDGLDSTDFLRADGTASDSELLDGMDSSEFLGAGDTAADSELLDGMDSTDFAPAGHSHDATSFSNTVMVQGDDTPTANGDALAAALTSVAGATATEPKLVLLDPGVYDLGSQRVEVPEFVTLAGAGEMATTIRGAGTPSYYDGVVQVASSTRIRDLAIEAAGDKSPVALTGTSNNVGNVEVDDITVRVSGGVEDNWGISIGGQAVLRNVTVLVEGDGSASVIGINAGTDTRVESSDIRTGGNKAGLFGHSAVRAGTGDEVTVMDSTIRATGTDAVGLNVVNQGVATLIGGVVEAEGFAASGMWDTTTKVQDAILGGGPDSVNGTMHVSGATLHGNEVGSVICAGVYDAANVFYSDSCP